MKIFDKLHLNLDPNESDKLRRKIADAGLTLLIDLFQIELVEGNVHVKYKTFEQWQDDQEKTIS